MKKQSIFFTQAYINGTLMNGKAVSIVLVATVISASALALAAMVVLENVDYSITYELNGGTNSDMNPSTYKPKDGTDLYAAEKEGCVFIGWFLDEDLTEQITEISKGTRGDIKLYACWEKSEVGMRYTYDISGNKVSKNWFGNTNTPLSGSISYTYLTYRYGQGYYISYDRTLKTGTGWLAKTSTAGESYWSGDSDTEWTRGDDASIETIDGTKLCSVWITEGSDSTERQYVGSDNNVTYLMEYTETNGNTTVTLTYTLSEYGITDIPKEFEVTVYTDRNVSVTGSGTCEAYGIVTLRASGPSFSGWYSTSGDLLSSSDTYQIDILVSDVTVYARNDDFADVSSSTTTVTASPDVPLTDVTWTFYDNGNEVTKVGNALSYEFSSAGTYTLLYTGTDAEGNAYHGLLDAVADGIINKSYSWKYDKKTFTATLGIKYSDFLAKRNDTIERCQGTTAHDLSFVTYNDPYVIELKNQIMSQCAGKSDIYIANVMLVFTQKIEYQYDSDTMGVEEYWKYPLETLFDQSGDCEDTSILFCALAKSAGYDCALLLFNGHMAAGISVDGASGSYYTYQNKNYYYCETTTTEWYVGSTPNSQYSKALKVMPVA